MFAKWIRNFYRFQSAPFPQFFYTLFVVLLWKPFFSSKRALFPTWLWAKHFQFCRDPNFRSGNQNHMWTFCHYHVGHYHAHSEKCWYLHLQTPKLLAKRRNQITVNPPNCAWLHWVVLFPFVSSISTLIWLSPFYIAIFATLLFIRLKWECSVTHPVRTKTIPIRWTYDWC